MFEGYFQITGGEKAKVKVTQTQLLIEVGKIRMESILIPYINVLSMVRGSIKWRYLLLGAVLIFLSFLLTGIPEYVFPLRNLLCFIFFIAAITFFILGIRKKAFLEINSFGYKVRLQSKEKDMLALYTTLEKTRSRIFEVWQTEKGSRSSSSHDS